MSEVKIENVPVRVVRVTICDLPLQGGYQKAGTEATLVLYFDTTEKAAKFAKRMKRVCKDYL